ncbi:MAG: site-specific integrase [Myxococcales bacterium]|nr:site-specific integrase [Myxococcales bacterium]
MAVIARWTGLRIGSIYGLRPEDVNLRAATLRIRTGKTAAARRTIPIATGLRDELVALVNGAKEEGRTCLFRRNSHVGDAPSHNPATTLARAWTLAVEAGEAREEVWKPPTRKIARPDHAFRAAFQDHLVRGGVRDEVIDLLVGHAPRTTRAKHYATESARMEAMREALALLPPIDWRQVERPENVLTFPAAADELVLERAQVQGPFGGTLPGPPRLRRGLGRGVVQAGPPLPQRVRARPPRVRRVAGALTPTGERVVGDAQDRRGRPPGRDRRVLRLEGFDARLEPADQEEELGGGHACLRSRPAADDGLLLAPPAAGVARVRETEPVQHHRPPRRRPIDRPRGPPPPHRAGAAACGPSARCRGYGGRP